MVNEYRIPTRMLASPFAIRQGGFEAAVSGLGGKQEVVGP